MFHEPLIWAGVQTLPGVSASASPFPEFPTSQPWMLGLAIVVGTLIHEDLATIVAGMLVADGVTTIGVALPALYIGIVAGDLGLYGFGRLISRHRLSQRLAVGHRFAALKVWLDERVEAGVFVVRFLPGLRMPAYTTYGFFSMPFRRFLVSVMLAVTIWTTGLFSLSCKFGSLTEHWLGVWRWPAIIVAVMIPLLITRHLVKSRVPLDEDVPDDGKE